MTDNESTMRGQVMARLGLPANINDYDYQSAIRAAIAVLDGNTDTDPPNYTNSETDIFRVESKMFSGNGEGADKLRRAYQDRIIFASQGVPFFWITASALKRCEALVLEFVSLPQAPVYQVV